MISTVTESDTNENIFQKISIWIRYHTLVTSLALFIVIKSIILVIFILLFEILGFTVGDTYPPFHTGNTFFDLLGTRWDSSFYLIIAENGQYFDPARPNDTRVWNFAPLYPIFIRILMEIGLFFQIDIPVAIAAVIVANIFSLISIVLFHFVSQLYLSDLKAISATLLFSFFPTTFVFSTVAYAEPVYLMFVIFSWYAFEKKRYATTGITLALATLARYPGALIFFLYMVIYFGRKVRDQGIRQALGCLIAIPLFPLLVLINSFRFLYFRFKDQISIVPKIVENIESLINLNSQQKAKISGLLHFL
ncbi:MAG: mannosyltransferase family protein, partial [Promethearchaeota archaeon]